MASKKALTKSELLSLLAEQSGLQKKQVELVFENFASLVLKELKKGSEVKLADLGKFKIQKTKERIGRNPATGAQIKIPAKTKPKFVLAKVLKDSLK